jgi:hypothetical protein
MEGAPQKAFSSAMAEPRFVSVKIAACAFVTGFPPSA